MVDYLISIVLALIMFTIGSSLKPGQFLEIAKHPKPVVLGLILQMLFLPLIAFAIVDIINLPPEFKVGIMILSFCPGGTTANLVSYLVDADVALSIYLTSINSFLILISIPTLTYLSLAHFNLTGQEIHLSFLETILQVILIILLPVILGMQARRFFPGLILKIQKPLKYISIILLAAVFLIKFLASGAQGGSEITLEEIKTLLPITLFIHLLVMFLSYYLAKGFLSNHKACVTIGIEVGLQNTTLALLISSTMLENEQMAKPALVYALFSFFTTFVYAWVNKKFDRIHRLDAK
jgi:BASS family bile acid:Na+ symporter